jgi:methylated-DNA-[protein]-cysteine S-methyltransferase
MAVVSNALRWAALDGPLGRLVLRADRRGLVAVHLPNALPARLDPARRDDEGLADALLQVEEYLAGSRRDFDLALAPPSGSFAGSIRSALQAIPYGATATYGEVARAVGQPDRVRDVAAAIGRNRLPIVVPCHRVIGADGALVGYGGGLDRKRALLDLEAGGGRQETLW